MGWVAEIMGLIWVFARDEIILAVLGQWGLDILNGIELVEKILVLVLS